ncbi:MAG: AraC family transcriptional regulator [Cytophagales bacterium]|nr:MAG: AraC family transcriptional regulator [Cytophagales bacterium]
MKALFEKVTIAEQTSLLVKHIRMPQFDAPWHYHPEYELTYIVRSSGKRFVGDHISSFDAGDLVLVGPNLPHFWRNDDDQPADSPAEAVVVQFPATFAETVLNALPEASAIGQLLRRAQYGLRFLPTQETDLGPRLIQLATLDGMPRLLAFLTLLHELTLVSDTTLLASDGYQLSVSEAETERMKRVLDYMLKHFRTEIRIEQIASVAGMAPAAFCRYFRKRTGKSFVEYLNEVRISHARKLLTQNDMSVGQVGLECGFNNISHFHRQFRLLSGTTPLKYQVAGRGR